jgi:hypothetical protein
MRKGLTIIAVAHRSICTPWIADRTFYGSASTLQRMLHGVVLDFRKIGSGDSRIQHRLYDNTILIAFAANPVRFNVVREINELFVKRSTWRVHVITSATPSAEFLRDSRGLLRDAVNPPR